MHVLHLIFIKQMTEILYTLILLSALVSAHLQSLLDDEVLMFKLVMRILTIDKNFYHTFPRHHRFLVSNKQII